MVEVRLLAAASDAEGNPLAVDQILEVDEQTAAAWRAQGKASLIADEQARLQEVLEHGHFGDLTGREETGPLGSTPEAPGPQTDDPPPDPPAEPKRR